MARAREEEQNQVAFVAWFRSQFPQYADLLTLGSIGENIGPKRMARLKQMGLTPGFPDLFLALPMGEKITTDRGDLWYYLYHGLYIEMKSPKGRMSSNQFNIHAKLKEQKYAVWIARNWLEAKDVMIDYLTNHL